MRQFEEVIFNNGLRKIGKMTFYDCASLKRITLPSTVVEIGTYTFSGCRNLREVELNGVPQYLHSDAFRYCCSLERFLFPAISYRLENMSLGRIGG